MMVALAGLLISTVLLYIVFTLIREYNELVRTKFRFRFFALRDRLAMLVATGKLAEDSWEYKNIVATLNFHISAVEQLSIMRVIQVLVEYHTSTQEQRRVEDLSKRIDDKDVSQILVDYMNTTYDLIKRNSRIQVMLLEAAHGLVKVFAPEALGKVGPASRSAVAPRPQVIVNPNTALTMIESHRNAFRQNLLAAA